MIIKFHSMNFLLGTQIIAKKMPRKLLIITLLTISFIMNACPLTSLSAHNISHEQRESSFQAAKLAIFEKIQLRGDLPHVSVNRQLELLEQLAEFDLGQFLIERGGLNGYWTHYIITHPSHLTNHNYRSDLFSPLEAFILNSAPTCLATQQRFVLFKTQIQQHIHEGCSFASIPSGLMADLLDLDYSSLSTFTLNAIDLDLETLSQAQSYAKDKALVDHCCFSQQDAWKLDINEKFNLIVSNGLAIYEPDDKKVVALYSQFYSALKNDGILITSFLTPPPVPGLKTEWKLDRVNQQDALLQKILFVDILDAKWQVFRSEAIVIAQLKNAGFQDVEIFYDDAHIFPTVVAKK
jgi:SAM-dependent methyltransferase